MQVTFERILEVVQDFSPIKILSSKMQIQYGDIRFLDSSLLSIEDKSLYIGDQVSFTAYLDGGENRRDSILGAGFILIQEDSPQALNQVDFGVDLILLPSNVAKTKLYNSILDLFRSQRKLSDSSAALLNSMIEGKGLDYIIQVGSEILGNPVFLVDASTKLLAASSSTNVADAMWRELSAIGYGDTEKLAPYVDEGYVRQIDESHLPVLMDIGREDNLRRIVGKIVVKHKTIGYIGVLEHQKTLGQDDVHITGLLCDVVSAEMQKTKEYDNLSGVMHEYLLLDLLSEDGHLNPNNEARAKMLFPSPKHKYLVFAVDLSEAAYQNRAFGYLRWTFEHQIANCKSVFYADQIVLVISPKDEKSLMYTLEEVRVLLERYDLFAGQSRAFSDLFALRTYYLQAREALKIGLLHGSKKRLFAYENYWVLSLLLSISPQEKLEGFMEPALSSLTTYDKQYGTNYEETLMLYLDLAGDITKMAQHLDIHRNTAVHRIKRIEEVLEMDFDHGPSLQRLYLTLQIKKVLSD